MRLSALFSTLFLFFATTAQANWQKINDVDYTFGPFKIYNISLFTETGEYQPNTRPLMLTLKYDKPVDGRDFAISLARSWENLGIKVENQNAIITHLRKTFPNIDPKDSLSYISLADKGYFVLNDTVLTDEFSDEVNKAIVAVWLDLRVEIGKKITVKKKDKTETVTVPIANSVETQTAETATAETKAADASAPATQAAETEKATEKAPEQAVQTEQKSVNAPEAKAAETKPAENKAAENKVETKAPEAKAAETKTVETKTVETPKAAEKEAPQAVQTEQKSANTAETKATETSKTAEQPPAQAAQTEQQPANATETKPAVVLPTEQKKEPEKSEQPAEQEESPAPVIDAPVKPSSPTS